MRDETVLRGKRGNTPPVDVILARVAARQHGVLTTAQLLAAGLSHSAISKRVARGLLHRIGSGVYALGHGALSREGQWMAGVLAGGAGAALSRLPAGKLWEISRFSAPVTEVVSTHQRRPRPGVRFHRARSLHPRDVTSHRGIPVTSVHRLQVDLTDVLTPYQMTNVVHEAAFRGRFIEAATRDCMDRSHGRHKLWVLERAIALHHAGSAGTKSGGEDAFLALVEDFPEPLVNTGLAGFERDFHWPDLRLAVEIDGSGHGRPRSRADDARRDQSLLEAGYALLRFSDETVYQRPRAVLADLVSNGLRPR